MKASKVILNIMSVVCFIYGALYVFSLVFIPVGIYCFIGGRKFSYKAEHLEDTFTIPNKVFKTYVIFSCVLCFPFGLLSLIPYFLIASNNVKVTNKEENNFSNEEYANPKVETIINENQETTSQTDSSQETEQEKQEKFRKLQNFHDKGLITDDELEMAREQLFGKKDN